MQVAITPKLVAVSVERVSVTAGAHRRRRSLLGERPVRDDRAVVRRFVKPVEDVETDPSGGAVAMQGVPVHEVEGGLPCLGSAVSWLSCAVRHTGDWRGEPDGPASHVLFVGEVVDAGEATAGGAGDDPPGILRMEDTRMNYGG